jgi:O-antigen ligase
VYSATAISNAPALWTEAKRAKVGVTPAAVALGRTLLAATLLVLPLPFGAVEPWAWGMLAAVAALLLALWVAGSIGQPVLRVVWSPLYIPTVLFFLFCSLQLLGHFTRDQAATRESLLKLATDLILFFLALQFWGAAPRRAWLRAGFAVAALAFSLSVFAILQFFSNPGLIYFSVRPRWGGWIFGPYVNHNHYAGLMEMLIPVAVGLFLSLHPHAAGRLVLGFAVLVPVASVLLSGSRGGFVALQVEVLMFLAILARVGVAGGRRFLAAQLGLGITAAALIFFWMDPGAVAGHLATIFERQPAPQVEAGFEARATLSKDAVRMFWDHPVAGTGLGSFEVAYPRRQSFPSDEIWDHAHDDYAEALAETGLPGGVLILASLVIFVRLAFRNLPDRLDGAPGMIQLSAAIGCCGLLVHGLFDFNLHIPANAAWFALCAAWATCGLARGPVKSETHAQSEHHGLRATGGRTRGARFPEHR